MGSSESADQSKDAGTEKLKKSGTDMKKDSLSKLETILRGIFLCLAVAAIAGVLMLVYSDSAKPYITEAEEEEATLTEYDWEQGLADASYWLPANCDLYEELPNITFDDAMGEAHSITEWKGKKTVVVFWASWCEDCQGQMAQMKAYEELAEKYGEIAFLYINKTDESRETRESAKEYFEALGLKGELYFDTSLRACDRLGIHNIPTTLFLNGEGVLTAWQANQIKEASVFEALLKNAVEGNAKSTAEFVLTYMMDEEGGIHSAYLPGKGADQKTEVLSESQGLGLLYAVSIQDKELFDRILSYVKNKMWVKGLAAWKVEDGQAAGVNALIDDFRIYRALYSAENLWGGYAAEINICETLLAEQGISRDGYVDFFDCQTREYASRFTLCYADLRAMNMLVEKTDDQEIKKACENAEQLLLRGQISNEFPLYYSWYNYDKERYENDDLNTAEAMMTLLHLARQGKLKNNTIDWLKARMAGEGLKMRYNVKGQTVKGYDYESTAVYAILVMIADEAGEEELRAQALKKLEKMRIADMSLEYNGAYGMEDGSGITSFDQLMPMLAYRQLEE